MECKNIKIEHNYCLLCDKEIVGRDWRRKKFCNSSCAAKYNNSRRIITDEQKQKTSNSLLKRNAINANMELDEYKKLERASNHKIKHEYVCKICGKKFKSSRKGVVYCSSQCSNKDQEVKQKLKNKVQERIKNGTFSGWKVRNKPSYPEKFWINVLTNHNISFIREDFSTKKYFLDFLIKKNDKMIDLEIDGKQHKYSENIIHDKIRDEYLISLGYIVYRIDWNYINNEKGKTLMNQKINDFINFYNLL